jgi:hypothetical protein
MANVNPAGLAPLLIPSRHPLANSAQGLKMPAPAMDSLMSATGFAGDAVSLVLDSLLGDRVNPALGLAGGLMLAGGQIVHIADQSIVVGPAARIDQLLTAIGAWNGRWPASLAAESVRSAFEGWSADPFFQELIVELLE